MSDSQVRDGAAHVLSAADTALLLAVAGRVAPETAELDAAGRAGFVAVVERALALRPPEQRAQFRLFLRLVRWLPAPLYLRPFEQLRPEQADGVLRWFQDAPVKLLRIGFWGTKTLVFMGYYGRPEIGPAIGYRPPFAGHDAA